MPVILGSTVARFAHEAGFTRQRLIIMVAIARAESGWNTSAHALTSREDSRGLYQINVRAHPWGRNIDLYNGWVNTLAAHRVYNEAGGSFTPWSVWLHCSVAFHLDKAIQAVRAYGKGADRGDEQDAIRTVSKHCELPEVKVGGTDTEWTREMLERTADHAAHEEWLRYATRGVHRGRRLTRGRGRAAWDIVRRRI